MKRHLIGITAVALVAFVAACGSSSGAQDATSTSAPSASAKAHATEEATLTATGDQPTVPLDSENDTCRDPYANGAPYPATPGEPLRLRPTGSPQPITGFHPLAVSNDAALDRVIRDSIGAESEHLSVVVKNLDDATGASIDAGRIFYPASLYKMWVLLEAYRQRDAGLIDFDERYIVSSYYENLRLNQGELPACSEVTVTDALRAMISVSDNVAANLLYDRVGYSNVNDLLRQLGIGYSGLFTGGDLKTTATGMATVFEAMMSGQVVSPGASEEMIALLEADAIDDRIPALLPPGIPVAHKTGNWDNATHDVGIVYSPNATYLIVILTDYGYSGGGAGKIARLSKAVYDYYNPGG